MRLVMAVTIALAGGAPAAAQQVGCAASETVGSIGVSLIECDCVIAPAASGRQWRFRSEPKVVELAPGGAAAGHLEPGDVITRVNGHAITTEAGALQLARLTPNQPVTLTIRRGERLLTEVLNPVAACPNDPKLLAAVPAAQRVAVAPAGAVAAGGRGVQPSGQVATVAPTRAARAGGGVGGGGGVGSVAVGPRGSAPTVAPAGPGAWIGIAFSCSDCAYQADPAGARWFFSTPPEVYSVEPGSPAYAAGIRRGDVLTHIDDQAITAESGGRRWAQIRPGDRVRLRYRRGTAMRTVSLEAKTPRGIVSQATVRGTQAPQLRALEATLANVDTVSLQLSRLTSQHARTEQTARQLQENQLQLQQLLEQLQRQSPEERRRTEATVQTLMREQQELMQQQSRQVAELARLQRVQAERLAASRDTMGRAVTALSGTYVTGVPGEERLRYSGTFAGTDVEVRGVSAVVVSETPTELTIRVGDTLITLRKQAALRR